jgi:hypothetical protein
MDSQTTTRPGHARALPCATGVVAHLGFRDPGHLFRFTVTIPPRHARRR